MKVHLTFHGAAGTVTGSRYHLARGDTELLVDAGLFQGLKRLRLLNWQAPRFDPRRLERVLLTHAHLDHTGYLPRLEHLGFDGEILTTPASVELAKIVLKDAGKLQEEDAEYANRKGYSRHRPAKPLFTSEDAEAVSRRLRPVDFEEWIPVGDGLRARWRNTGHLLGAAMIEMRCDCGDREISVLFSGDVGRYDYPLHIDPLPRPSTDVLVIESTYGNRDHPDLSIEDQLAGPLRETFDRGGVAMIPAFALGRSQVVALLLRRCMKAGKIPEVPIHIDSPMAIDATAIYSRHLDATNLDRSVFADGRERLFPDNVRLVRSTQESKRLNEMKGPRIIIAGSGMLTGGRILHHLRVRLPDPKNLVCLVGYQADGTRGRRLFRGEDTLRIHGRDIPVRAKSIVLNGLSGHADRGELLRWYRTGDGAPAATFVTHGEPGPAGELAETLRKETGHWVHTPQIHERFELGALAPAGGKSS